MNEMSLLENPQSTSVSSECFSESAKLESEFFDQHIKTEGDFNPFTERGWRTLSRRFAEWLPIEKPVDLLDVGCGTGCSRQIYIRSTNRYTGVDLSQEAIRLAQTRFPDSVWIHADACQLPFEEDRFDVVAFSSVLHHIPNFQQAVEEAVRVLRPDGWVFAFDPNVLHPAMALFRHPSSPFYSSKGVSPNERPLSAWSLYEAFQLAGLREIRQRGQSDIPYRAVPSRVLNSFLTTYNMLDWGWETFGLGRWFGTFLLTSGRVKCPATS